MTATVHHQIAAGRATLAVAGRFDFSIHRDFRHSYEEILAAAGVRQLDVDLSGVEYIDSSALGMLLLLREKAGGRNIEIRLANASGPVRQVLEVANFGRLFEIA
jgi:anti-anti-sigma factor